MLRLTYKFDEAHLAIQKCDNISGDVNGSRAKFGESLSVG